MDRTLRRHFVSASLALALLLVANAAHAVVWTHLVGGDASGNWNTAGNWAGSAIPDGQDAVADFATLNITTDSTATLDTTSRTVGTLRFGDAATASNDWTLSSSGRLPLRS